MIPQAATSMEQIPVLDALIERDAIDFQAAASKRPLLADIASQKGMSQALLETFALAEDTICLAIAETYQIPVMTIADEIEKAPTNIFTEQEILQYRVLPLFTIGMELTIAVIDPPTPSFRNQLQKLTGVRILPVVTTISDFTTAFHAYKGVLDKIQRLSSALEIETFDVRSGKAPSPEETDIGLLLGEILFRAIKAKASDIHIEPAEGEITVRFRIDGTLRRIVGLPRQFLTGILAVVKERSGMDMFEQQKPQDGLFSLMLADRSFDVRVNSLPLIQGEKLVMRLLGKNIMMGSVDTLGFSERNLRLFRRMLTAPNGIILVTGPTGSGKTTTLYSALNEIKGFHRNITTVENPVEYQLPLINQVQVSSDPGLTFASTLRAILRQDPDVILLGEIRDKETGVIATEAALTGHLVLSTLHTNDAIGAVPRFINLGIEAYWVGASVIGIVAQRLVRKICPSCRQGYTPDAQNLRRLGLSGLEGSVSFFRGRGCSLCAGTGYDGRLGIHEVLPLSEDMKDLVFRDSTITSLRRAAVLAGFRDMYFDGLQKVLAGMTTVEEVLRVTTRSV